MNDRWLLIIATLLPMTVYYLLLSFAPQRLATYSIIGIPGSLFWGVVVMFWGVLMAFIYVYTRQKKTRRV